MLGRKGDKPYAPANTLCASPPTLSSPRLLALTLLYAADFAGGGMLAALGILAALIERGRSGKGQIVETNMVQYCLSIHRLQRAETLELQVTGTRYASIFPLLVSRPSIGLPMWNRPRGENILDGGAPWYDVYETSDGGYMSLGAIEGPFYKVFLFVLPSLLLPARAHTHLLQ